MTKAKDMTQEQIVHTFCTWCNHRLLVAGNTYWGCSLKDKKKEEELCLYKKAVQQEEQ